MSAPPPQSNYDIIVLILLAFLLGLTLDYLTFRSQRRDLVGSNNCIKLMLLGSVSRSPLKSSFKKLRSTDRAFTELEFV